MSLFTFIWKNNSKFDFAEEWGELKAQMEKKKNA